jgi:hypothetical protein
MSSAYRRHMGLADGAQPANVSRPMKALLPTILMPVLAGASFWTCMRFARADEHPPTAPPSSATTVIPSTAAHRTPKHKPITREHAIEIALAFLEAQPDARYYTWHPGTVKTAFLKDCHRWWIRLEGDPSPAAQRAAAEKPWSGLPAVYTTDIELMPDGQIVNENFLCIAGW